MLSSVLPKKKPTSHGKGLSDVATHTVEFTPQTPVWYRSGKPPVLIRWILIRGPQGAFDLQALLCTNPTEDPTQILEWFVLRWQLEVTPYQVRGRLFQEVRTHLGLETPAPVARPGHRPHHA